MMNKKQFNYALIGITCVLVTILNIAPPIKTTAALPVLPAPVEALDLSLVQCTPNLLLQVPTQGIQPTGKLSERQAELLAFAYKTAKADGHTDPSVLQGLIWQESKAGGYPGHEVAGDEYGLKVGKRYYGIGQIKVSAAKDVFKRFPADFPEFIDVTDEEIIAHLIMDDEFNIRVASKYLWHMKHSQKNNFERPVNYAITAYNRGLGNTYDTDYNNWHYTVAVHKHKDTFIKTFNLANNLK